MTQTKHAETAKILRVKDWDSNFENNRTRDLKHMAWIPVSNKHDGDGYTCLVDHENGAAHLGVWIAILQVASKCGVRGTLLRDNGHPHAAGSISRLTRLPKALIDETIERLLSHDIQWLEVVDKDGVAQISQDSAVISHPTDYGTEGKEQNGTEGKEQNGSVFSLTSEDTESSQLKQKAQAKKKKNTYTPDFEEWWVAYEKKGVKADAFKRWKEADLPALDELIQSTKDYVAHCKSVDRSQRDGAGYFTGMLWESEWTISSPPPGSTAPINADNI